MATGDGMLAALVKAGVEHLKIAVAFEPSRLSKIRPQAHVIGMDHIVAEAGVHRGDRG